MKAQLSVGEFARLAGVSVRTLQYYDKIGLFRPSGYSDVGRRVYHAGDVARFQQIVTLKLIGLSLDEIKVLLTNDSQALPEILARQKQALREKVRQFERVIDTIAQAEAALSASSTVDLNAFVSIIQEINMSQQTDWIGQFLSDEQQAQLQQGTLEEQRRIGQAFKQLFEDIQTYLAGEADPARADALAARWHTLMQTYTNADSQLQENLEAAYAHIAENAELLPEARAWLQQLQDSARFVSDT